MQSSFSLKILIFFSVFPHQSLAEEWLILCVFNKKSKFCLEIVTFSWLMEFFRKYLSIHPPLAEEWLFFCFYFNKKIKVFVVEENLGLHKKELLKYHETFPILVFEGSLSIEQSQACCPAEHKNKVSRLTISKIIRTEHQNSSWLSLILYCM